MTLEFIDPDEVPTPDVFVAPFQPFECHGWTWQITAGQGVSTVWMCPTCGTVFEATTPLVTP